MNNINKTPVYKRITDICVDMYTNDNAVEKRALRGKVFLNSEKGEIAFLQNKPRGQRSVEVGRTPHSRSVRRPDGDYTVTFRINARERYLRETLLAELRSLVTLILSDSHHTKHLTLNN